MGGTHDTCSMRAAASVPSASRRAPPTGPPPPAPAWPPEVAAGAEREDGADDVDDDDDDEEERALPAEEGGLPEPARLPERLGFCCASPMPENSSSSPPMSTFASKGWFVRQVPPDAKLEKTRIDAARLCADLFGNAPHVPPHRRVPVVFDRVVRPGRQVAPANTESVFARRVFRAHTKSFLNQPLTSI